MKKYIFYITLILVGIVLFTSYEFIKYKDDDLRLVVCDVGQGDAIFITTPGKSQILIDGGPGKSVLECLSNNMPFWDRSIDMVILTHPHADHYSGLIHVIERYSVKSFYTANVKSDAEGFNLLKAKLAEKRLTASYLAKNDGFSDKNGVKIKILSPDKSRLRQASQNISKVDFNSISIVALLTYGNFSALLTGDAEEEVMKSIESRLGKVKVLKVGHQGSSGSVNDNFLEIVDPDVGIISVGENNKFGHPTEDTLDILERNKVKILRTDTDGEIKVLSDGNTFFVNKDN